MHWQTNSTNGYPFVDNGLHKSSANICILIVPGFPTLLFVIPQLGYDSIRLIKFSAFLWSMENSEQFRIHDLYIPSFLSKSAYFYESADQFIRMAIYEASEDNE